MSSCICLWDFINAHAAYGGLVFGGDGICSQSWVASPYTTIGMVSVLLHLPLPLPLPFSIVKALGNSLGKSQNSVGVSIWILRYTYAS